MLKLKLIGIAIFSSTLYLFIQRIRRMKVMNPASNLAIFITGCDSGLGYSMALYCNKLGLTVFAGCKNIDGEGATKLKQLSNACVLQLDVRNTDSIAQCLATIKCHQETNDTELKCLVNNAGVMMFGEFHWLTEEMILEQINVNLIGAMRITKMFLSLLRVNQGRIINVSSHCAREPLPGLSVYGASKSGLLAWSNALRVELNQYNIEVISFVPGSFVQETCILSNQANYTKKMIQEMAEDDLRFYKDYILEYDTYLRYIPKPDGVKEISSKIFYDNFHHAILSIYPYHHYCHSPKRYALYHFLLKLTPLSIHDWLLVKFTSMPRWKPKS